jgi:cobalt-zinc-cadmium efflux system membrane fusion protein
MAKKKATVEGLSRWTMPAPRRRGLSPKTTQAGGLGCRNHRARRRRCAPDGEAVLTARADGAVTRIVKRLGDNVLQAKPSPIWKAAMQRQSPPSAVPHAARLIAARAAYVREKKLFEAKVTARQDFEAAQATLAEAEAEARRTQSAAGAAKITGDGRLSCRDQPDFRAHHQSGRHARQLCRGRHRTVPRRRSAQDPDQCLGASRRCPARPAG